MTNPSILDGYEKVGKGPAGNHGNIQLCEPNDEWKGDFSRTYFYMATTYQNLTWQGTQGTAAVGEQRLAYIAEMGVHSLS